MNLRFPVHRLETWEELRRRLVAETELFITEALRHPELAIHIPMIPSESARFPPSLSRAFWDPILLCD